MLDQILNYGSKFVGDFIGGLGNNKGSSSSQDSASSAALEKLGFAQEREVAMQITENAARRGSTRGSAREEQIAKKDLDMTQDVASIYRQAFQDNKVAQATLEQLKRQGLIERIPPKIRNQYASLEEAKLKPASITDIG